MVLRQAGKYLEDQIEQNKTEFLLECGTMMMLCCLLIGLSFAGFIGVFVKSNVDTYVAILKIILLIWIIFGVKRLNRTQKQVEKDCRHKRKGLAGEKEVEYELSLLQGKYNDFYVVNDFQNKRVGNIDHVIISTKGIFTLEVKNVKFLPVEKVKRQATKEALALKDILKNFGVSWVTPVICPINIEQIKYIHSKHVKSVASNRIDSIFKDKVDIIDSHKALNIYKSLIKLQQ